MSGAERSPGQVSVGFVPPDVVEVAFRGHVGRREVERALGKAREVAEERRARFFLLDATQTTSYDAEVRTPGAELLAQLRAAGVRFGVCATPSSAVRMIGAAVTLVGGLPVKFVETRSEAMAMLEVKRSER